ESLRKFSTVFGASSSNSSKVIAPSVVFIVAADIVLPYPLQAHRLAPQVATVERLDHPLCLARRDRQEGESVQHDHVANRLAIQTGGGRDGADDVRHLQANGPPPSEHELDVALAIIAPRQVRLGVAPRALADGRRRGHRALLPLGDAGTDVAFDRLELALL